MDFTVLDYLKNGNIRQQKAYNTLRDYQIMESLIAFQPILVGTIPIEIDIEGSDLDIICELDKVSDFLEHLDNHFSTKRDYKVNIEKWDGQDVVIANFMAGDFPIEIFAQHRPTKLQNGYLHMVIEQQILAKMGASFQEKIIALKQQGIKTEPAFAQLLRLEGDPYQALLHVNIDDLVP